MTAKITIDLEIEGTLEDAQYVVEAVLDDGVLQDAINGHELDAGPLEVVSAMPRGLIDRLCGSAPVASEQWIVICRADRNEDGTPGPYQLTTRTVFATVEAANRYAAGISPSREAIVVPGRFAELRFNEERGR